MLISLLTQQEKKHFMNDFWQQFYSVLPKNTDAKAVTCAQLWLQSAVDSCFQFQKLNECPKSPFTQT